MVLADILVVVLTIVAILGMRAAYRNGCTDGYGYSREPNCPGYQKAGDYLKRTMAHRWPELANGGVHARPCKWCKSEVLGDMVFHGKDCPIRFPANARKPG